jgi:hypothetical protein
MSKVSAIVVLLSFLSVASGFALAPQTRTSQLQSQQQLSMGLLDAFGLGKKPLTVSEEFGVPKPPNARYIYPKMPDTGERRRFFFSVAFLLSRSLPHSVASLHHCRYSVASLPHSVSTLSLPFPTLSLPFTIYPFHFNSPNVSFLTSPRSSPWSRHRAGPHRSSEPRQGERVCHPRNQLRLQLWNQRLSGGSSQERRPGYYPVLVRWQSVLRRQGPRQHRLHRSHCGSGLRRFPRPDNGKRWRVWKK